MAAGRHLVEGFYQWDDYPTTSNEAIDSANVQVQAYGGKGLVVLGFPCNQFGAQDPGSDAEIGAFCVKNYGVSFPMMSKIDVNGDAAHPLYQWLTKEAPGLLGSKNIKWNFTKFLVGKDGRVLKRYAPQDAPASLAKDVEAALSA